MSNVNSGESSKKSEDDSRGVFRTDLLSRIALNDNKAGMEGLDREKINKIILETSKVDKLRCDLERSRELGRVIVHVDMDAFYAAVEMRDCPELKDKPMAVGSMSMLSTSNYHARRFGVRAAMPGFIAKKLCPNLVIVPTNFDKYRAVSAQVREVFSEYDPHFMPDSPTSSPTLPGAEAKMEVFGTSAEEAVREMRFRIEQKTSLTASAGIAPNMMLAKVCSDKNKPNGQYLIYPERRVVMDFMKDLPVRKVSGVGKVTEKMLAALGIVTCAHLSQQMALLSLLFSENSWHHFLHISLGLGSTHIERDSERKSMSTERTFGEMSDVEEQYTLCRELSRDLAQDLQREGLKGKTVTLKLKNVQFEVKTRAFTLQYPVCDEEDIFGAAKELLRVEIESVSPHPLKLRLMGVRVSSFTGTEEKKALQRSIKGFLQKGASDSCSTQSEHNTEEVAKRATDFLKPQPTEMKKNNPRAPQQQSFFQKAQLKRLQKQLEGMAADTTVEATTQTSVPTTNSVSDKTFVVFDTTPHVHKDTKPSRNISNHEVQCLVCPVCNIEVKEVNLKEFNHHIDECLKGCALTEQQEDGDTEAAESNSENQSLLKQSVCRDETPSTSASLPVVETDDGNDFKTPVFTPRMKLNGFVSKATSKPSPSTHSQVTEVSHDGKGSSLICPVCSQPQNTNDLILFNRHVDVCLSQDVLQEFRGSHPPVDHSDALPALKSRGVLETEKDFIEAAKRNDVESMKLLGRGLNVNSKNVHGRTALHYAVAFKNVEAVDVLLRRRAKLDLQDKEGLNMMHCAAMNNHTDIVAYIFDDLQMGELDKEDHFGNRPFALAAAHGSVRMLQMLMEENYNMATMEKNKVGDTPLHLAARQGQCEALQLLLENFELRDDVNQAGETALYLAAYGAHEDCVQTLLDAQCDPNIYNLSRITPLHSVCETGHFTIVKLLIEGGAQINAQNQHLQTPFHLAVKNCHVPVIHTLLEAGCDPNITDHMGQTALHIIAEIGKVDVLEMILKAGVDLQIQDRQHKTALGVAARGDMAIIVDMIIKAERYFKWRHSFELANTDAKESFHSQSPLTFKLDHSTDMKPVRDIIWELAYKHLKRNEWKKLAELWEFTDDQMAAIEEQWTGPNSFQEHGNRMLLIWLHRFMMEESSPTKGLHEGLLAVGNTKIADIGDFVVH
ncbi:hypothetical protein DNTS_022663 [Danionella cerebrum]|uniref:DNA polymerase kappa n=1 Tax=Danionella cerebrum TaxID=2873325 RepID=A0A553NGK9_9TELE|nr:hypothetical protein DNTS_022663 [Danionella translucida]